MHAMAHFVARDETYTPAVWGTVRVESLAQLADEYQRFVRTNGRQGDRVYTCDVTVDGLSLLLASSHA